MMNGFDEDDDWDGDHHDVIVIMIIMMVEVMIIMMSGDNSDGAGDNDFDDKYVAIMCRFIHPFILPYSFYPIHPPTMYSTIHHWFSNSFICGMIIL